VLKSDHSDGIPHEQIVKYIAEFFLELEMFRTNVVRKIKTHLICKIFFPKIVRFGDNLEKCGSTRLTDYRWQ